MKAWFVQPKDEFYAEIVFAETRGQARSLALSFDGFDDCSFTDIEVRRAPYADKYYKEGKVHLDWDNPKDRVALVKDCDFVCDPDYRVWEDCESREHFKELIKEEYGENIAFRNSKKLNIGDLYCIIIGEHCYNTERYFNRIEYTCACCGGKVVGYINNSVRLENWDIRNELCNQVDKYGDLRFCSYKCKEHFITKERQKCLADGLVDESFITREDFKRDDIAGYIYKISKKSTGEFYIGQTIYLPIFRWGQHLKTDRFDIKGLLDYQFEVIEIVPITENILEREKYYIRKYYKENPELSLNIACTKGLERNENEISNGMP